MLRPAISLAVLLAATAAAQDGDGIAWRTDLEAARADATRTNRPLFVVFRCEP